MQVRDSLFSLNHRLFLHFGLQNFWSALADRNCFPHSAHFPTRLSLLGGFAMNTPVNQCFDSHVKRKAGANPLAHVRPSTNLPAQVIAHLLDLVGGPLGLMERLPIATRQSLTDKGPLIGKGHEQLLPCETVTFATCADCPRRQGPHFGNDVLDVRGRLAAIRTDVTIREKREQRPHRTGVGGNNGSDEARRAPPLTPVTQQEGVGHRALRAGHRNCEIGHSQKNLATARDGAAPITMV
jgi:hypothetical protein